MLLEETSVSHGYDADIRSLGLLEFKMCLCGLRNVDYAFHYDFMPSKAYLILTLCVLFT